MGAARNVQPFIDFTGVFYFRHLLAFKNAAMEILFWYNVIYSAYDKRGTENAKKKKYSCYAGGTGSACSTRRL